MTGKTNACRGCRQAFPQSQLMRLMPCRCVLCKDCLIEFLFAVCSKKLDLECCACRQAVTSLHVTECQPTCKSEQHAATSSAKTIDFSKEDDQNSDEENKVAANTNNNKRKGNEEIDNSKVKKRTRRCTEKGLQKWNKKIEELKAYKEHFGDCLVPWHWNENIKLSEWVTNQRRLYNQGLLRPERKQELEAIGFAWRGREKKADISSIHKEGDDDTQSDGGVAKNNTDDNKKPKQRQSKKRKICSSSNEGTNKSFEQWLESLTVFKNKHGHCRAKFADKEFRPLYRWSNDVRNGNRKLTEEQRQKLIDLGFDFDSARKVAFNDRMSDLQSFKAKHGHCRVTREYEDFKELWQWLKYVRNGNIKISPDHRQQLMDFGFDFAYMSKLMSKGKSFEDRIKDLQSYKAKFGHCRITRKCMNSSMHAWAVSVRNGKIETSQEQRQQLTDLGFDFDSMPKRMTFDDRIKDLLSFKSKHGHCRVPYGCKEPKGLDIWVKNVRGGETKINKEQRKQLNEIGFVWETGKNRYSREWKVQFDKLKAYKARYGDCMVPWNWKEDRMLSNWVHTQRKKYAKGAIKPDRKEMLESIGFAWRGRGPGRGNLSASRNAKNQKPPHNTAITYEEEDDDDEDDDDEDDDDLDSKDDHNYNIQWDNSHWQNAVQQGFTAGTEYHL